jgi:hypothetical protein
MNRLALYALFALVLSACATTAPGRGPIGVPPGKVYAGSYINVTAPKSDGWYLMENSGRGIAFARSGSAPGESFAAQVLMFPLEPTNSPEEFDELIVKQSSRDTDPHRFRTTESSHSYSAARGYPCVRMHTVSTDRDAQVGGGKTEVLILEVEHLYCRHPVQAKTGFVAMYSYRGRARHPQLKDEALSFIEGVQVPDAPAR